jgi:uncharacterized membrane protein YgcG
MENQKRSIFIAATAVLILGMLAGCEAKVERPTNLKAESVGPHEITATWDASENATEYDVVLTAKAAVVDEVNSGETGKNRGGSGEAAAETPATPERTKTTTGTSITFDGLPTDTEYEISVLAVGVNGDKRTEAETPLNSTIKTAAPEVGKVSEITATATSDTEIGVNWSAYDVTDIVNADGTQGTATYTLYVSEAESGEFVPAAENTVELSFAHTGLTEKTARWYKVVPTLTVDGKTFVGAESDIATAVTNETPIAETEPATSSSSGSDKTSGGKTSTGGNSDGTSGGSSGGGNSSTPAPSTPAPVDANVDRVYCYCGEEFPSYEAWREHNDSYFERYARREISQEEMDRHKGYASYRR